MKESQRETRTAFLASIGSDFLAVLAPVPSN